MFNEIYPDEGMEYDEMIDELWEWKNPFELDDLRGTEYKYVKGIIFLRSSDNWSLGSCIRAIYQYYSTLLDFLR